jgi:bidirectional [NiFe] hydrogenase diaphorase subunit
MPAARPKPRHAAAVSDGPTRVTANVCCAASCVSAQSDQILKELGSRVSEAGLDDVHVKRVGCLGLCAAGPLIQIPETGKLLKNVTLDTLDPVVEELRTARPTGKLEEQPPFFSKQVRVATENMGSIDPEDIDDYLAHSGYEALRNVLASMTPAEVRDEITRSGLRGRGGAGYGTGLKWTTVAKAQGSPKYVICNADEGDPGAFMDRSVLESDPYRVLEGMARATSTAAPSIRSPWHASARRSAAPSAAATSARPSPTRTSTSTSRSASVREPSCAARKRP